MKINIKLCLALGCGLAAGAARAATNEAPKFDEVYQLLRSNLTETTEAGLNRAAVEGLLRELDSRAMLAPASGAQESPALGRPVLYDDSFAYFRVLKVETNLAGELTAAYQQLAQTNKSRIKGVLLDLRFAGGADFAAAAAAADCFLNSDQPLLECGGEMLRATKKENAISVPLAVLVNAHTTEAAEALAAMLRETSTGLLLGGRTAGRANVFKEFPLSDGDELRIAVGHVKLGDGTVFAEGVKPDIAVDVNAAGERAAWEAAGQSGKTTVETSNPSSSSVTNGGYHVFNEAELVREQRDGADLEAEFGGGALAAESSGLKKGGDLTLQRALDLLKGLAVVQQGHPG